MTAQARRGYRFSTPAQWGTCLFDRVDRESSPRDGDVRPIAPYEQTAQLYATQGAHAPAAHARWRDPLARRCGLPASAHGLQR